MIRNKKFFCAEQDKVGYVCEDGPCDKCAQTEKLHIPCDGNCGMNYCDENGCIERKRELVEPPFAPNNLMLMMQNNEAFQNHMTQLQQRREAGGK